MHIAWTAHLANKPEEKELFQQTIQHSKAVLDRLTQLIEEEEALLDRIECTPSEYEVAGWPFKQAHINGRKGALAYLKQFTKG